MRGLLALLLVLAALWGYEESKQWILRVRAQKLLSDLQKLQVKESNWDDLQRFRAKWGWSGDYRGICDQDYCLYSVAFESQPRIAHFSFDITPYPKLRKLIEMLGLRREDAAAYVVLRRGLVVAKAFEMDVVSFGPTSANYFSIVSEEGPSVYDHSRDRALHPNHGFYLTNRDDFLVTFTPDENAEEKARLMGFRFHCLTAIHACSDREMLLPEAVAEFKSEAINVTYDLPKCNVPFWIDARDAQAVGLADVLSAELARDNEPGDRPQWNLVIKMRRLLKGRLVQLAAKPVRISTYDDRLMPLADGSFPYKTVLIAGRIINFNFINGGPQDLQIDTDTCQVVGATSENLEQAALGIARDFSPEPLVER